MSNKRFYTVCFEITEEGAWKHYGAQFTQSLATDEPVHHGVRVTACGTGDVMTGFDALSDVLSNNGHDVDDCIREWCAENDISPEDTQLIIG